MDNILFFVEGIHDANCIAKVLMINNFKSIKSMDELPIIWKNRIPRVYPFVKQRLDRSVQIPLYFTNNEIFIVIICCNGETNIIKDIDVDLILCGHTHGGVVPWFLRGIFGTNGIISPSKSLFPKKCYGRIKKDNKNIIITSGITMLAPSHLKLVNNFLYSEVVKIDL